MPRCRLALATTTAMNHSRGANCVLAGLGLALATLSGCQTWVPATGQTLPSPRYLQHPPQYFPPSPAFPLSRELASQERAAAAAAAGGGALPLEAMPPRVPGGGAAVPPAPLPPPAP